MLRVFNRLQQIFARFEAWKEHLDTVLHTTADLEEMLCITAPLFGNSLGLCNKQLELVASADADGSMRHATGMPLSEARVAKFADSHAKNTAMRELFTYTLDGEKSYCLNIYAQDCYLGLLTLSDDGLPVTPGKLALLAFFFQYIRKAVLRRIEHGNSNIVTLKAIFSDLINCIPVSSGRINKALSGTNLEKTVWCCMALKPAKAMESIPAEYLCTQIEENLSRSIAFSQDRYVVVFLPEGGGLDSTTGRQMLQHLFDHGGISNSFLDLREARFAYRQAVIAQEVAEMSPDRPRICAFQDCALAYALKGSLGELPPEQMIPRGLIALLEEDKREEDYSRWNTLKVYLDNEMNATKTARDLYIHRTTLQNRLKSIEKKVALTTPASRLYLRYGLYLYELFGLS